MRARVHISVRTCRHIRALARAYVSTMVSFCFAKRYHHFSGFVVDFGWESVSEFVLFLGAYFGYFGEEVFFFWDDGRGCVALTRGL